MSPQDRTLAAIVGGVVVLVAVALLVVRLRPAPTYRTDDAPEAAAHNYLLALERADWARAYGALDPNLACYPPSLEVFVDDVTDNRWIRSFDNVELRVESDSVEGDIAVVKLRETRMSSGGLFEGGQSTNDFEMKLRRGAEGWRITRSDGYWLSGWHDPGTQSCDAWRNASRLGR